MRSRGIEGRVTVQMVVGKDGAVEAASVIQSSGYGVMDKAALSAAYTYAFAPAYKEGYASAVMLEDLCLCPTLRRTL